MLNLHLIRELERQGVVFELSGNAVKVKARKGVLTPEIDRILAENKQQLKELVSRLSDNLHYWHSYHERAGMYTEAGQPEPEAERLAYQSTLVEYCQTLNPEIIAAFEAAIYQPQMN